MVGRTIGRTGRWAALAAIGVLVVALGRSGVFETAIEGITSLGSLAMPVFVLLHVVSVVAFVPSLLPTFAAGVIFGVAWGLPLTLLGAGIGAVLAFVLGRTIARAWAERRFGHDPRFQALSRLARERGWKIVAMARLTPIFPFSIGNYAFGMTPIPARQYLLATLLGTLPSNAVYVYLGAVAGEVTGSTATGRVRSPLEWALLVAGIVVAVALAVYVRRAAGEALASEAGAPPSAPALDRPRPGHALAETGPRPDTGEPA